MELKRVIGKDSKHAMELVRQEFGPDALVVSSHKVNRKFEMIVAVDITPDPSLIDQADDLLVEVLKVNRNRHHAFLQYCMANKKRAGYGE